MDFLTKIAAFLKSEWDYVFTAVSGVFSTILSEIPDDEIAIIHASMQRLEANLTSGKMTPGEAVADTWTYAVDAEGKELTKLGNLALQMFIEKTTPGT